MPTTTLDAISAFLDTLLRTADIPDYERAFNGVQFANRGGIRSVAAAVDFSSAAIQGAAAAGAGLLLVHHGMFWGGQRPYTGARFQQIVGLVEHDIGVYSSHLPLDVHPDLGNNVLLARELGLEPSAGFARFHEIEVGVRGIANIDTLTLVDRARRLARSYGGEVVVPPPAVGAERMTRRWGVCTGAGADAHTLREASERGLDTLIVGEGPHHSAVEARELGMVVIYAGHYATETLGVRALARTVARQYDLEWTFIDTPTGL